MSDQVDYSYTPPEPEPEPAPAAASPLGPALLSVVVGSVLLVVSLFAAWAKIGAFSVSGLDVGGDAYLVLAAGIVCLIAAVQLASGRLLSRAADRPLSLVGAALAVLAAAALTYNATRIGSAAVAVDEAAGDLGEFGAGLADALQASVGPGIYIGLAGALLAGAPLAYLGLRPRTPEEGTHKGALAAGALVAVAALAGAALLGSRADASGNALASAESTPSPTQTSFPVLPEDVAEEEPTEEPPTIDDLSVGESYTFGTDDGTIEGTVKVNSLETFKTGAGEFASGPELGYFAVANITVELTTGELSLNPFQFAVEFPDGTQYEYANGNSISSGRDEPGLNSTDMTAGQKRTGNVVFDIPGPNAAITWSPENRVIVRWSF